MELEVHAGYSPGVIGRVVELHAAFYSASFGFGRLFEAEVAAELSDFFRRFDPRRDGFWTARRGGRVEGAVAIDGSAPWPGVPQLRWFVLSEAERAGDAGRALLGAAVEFCRRGGHRRLFLSRYAGLDAARRLYDGFGSRLDEEGADGRWAIRAAGRPGLLVVP